MVAPKRPAAHHVDVSVAEADRAVGIPAPTERDVRVNGQSILRFGDKGLYAQCSKGINVPWWCIEGMTTVLVNGVEASAGDLTTGSIDGPGHIQASTTNVFLGGPVITKMERARRAALARLKRAEDALYRWSEEDQLRFLRWFGHCSDAERFAMMAKLQRMRDKLDGVEIVMGHDSGAYAEVSRYMDPNTVFVDQKFWRTPEDDGGDGLVDTESGVRIHESAHFSDTARAGDHAYGHAACHALAQEHPEDAQDNADSIEYFCEETP